MPKKPKESDKKTDITKEVEKEAKKAPFQSVRASFILDFYGLSFNMAPGTGLDFC
ncbi:hypothetical protein IKF20_00015 [Candidatus Saccharibacteria bacterium]|nr:hypothetical protein [Candidatus Saccharibacteria bacterium]